MIKKTCFLTMLIVMLTSGVLPAEETNPVLGKVGEYIIREADLDRILENQPPAVQKRFLDDPRQRFNLVREILTKKAIVAKAKKERFDRKPEVKEQLSFVIDNFIAQEYLVKVVTAGVTVPEEDLRKYYQEHEKDFLLPEQVKVRHILVSAPKEMKAEEKEKARVKAEAILVRVKKGEDFSKLATEVSEDQNSAPKGGTLAPITPGKTNSDEFEKAAFALNNGQTSDIVTTSYGFHIIKMDVRQEKRIAPFSEAREFINDKLKADLEQTKVREFMELIAKEAEMEVFGEKGDTSPKTREINKPANNGGDLKK